MAPSFKPGSSARWRRVDFVSFAEERRPYRAGALGDEAKDLDPLATLATWMQEARDGGDADSNVMALATVDPGGAPVVRYVLCKGVTARGLTFFTNIASRKGHAIAADPRVAATFWWPGPERSIRIVGAAEPLPRAAVDEYFASRPRGSRLGAWTSEQSQPVESRAALEAQAAAIESQFQEPEPLGAPASWGGYEVVVREVELWQGRDDRLHDRFRFVRDASGTGAWSAERLQP